MAQIVPWKPSRSPIELGASMHNAHAAADWSESSQNLQNMCTDVCRTCTCSAQQIFDVRYFIFSVNIDN